MLITMLSTTMYVRVLGIVCEGPIGVIPLDISSNVYCIFPQVAQVLPYNTIAVLYSWFTTIATNFVLNYNDIFIIIVSVVIVNRFRLLKDKLRRAVERVYKQRNISPLYLNYWNIYKCGLSYVD